MTVLHPEGLRWVACGAPPEGRVPLWARSAALAEDGTVFVPAATAGNEKAVFFCAAYDGVPLVMDGQHPFVPATWLGREYPEHRELCELIESRVRRHFGEAPA